MRPRYEDEPGLPVAGVFSLLLVIGVWITFITQSVNAGNHHAAESPLAWLMVIAAAVVGLLVSVWMKETLWPAIVALIISLVAGPVVLICLVMHSFSQM